MDKPVVTKKELDSKKEEIAKVIFSAQSADNENRKEDAYVQYINCLIIIGNQLLEFKLDKFTNEISSYVSSILHLLEHCCERLRSISSFFKPNEDVNRRASCVVPNVAKISLSLSRNHTMNFPRQNISRRNTIDPYSIKTQQLSKPIRSYTIHEINYEDSLELPLDISHTLDNIDEVNPDDINQHVELADNLEEANIKITESPKQEEKKLNKPSNHYIFSSDSENTIDDEDFYSDYSIDYNEIGIESANVKEDNKKDNKKNNKNILKDDDNNSNNVKDNNKNDSNNYISTPPVYPVDATTNNMNNTITHNDNNIQISTTKNNSDKESDNCENKINHSYNSSDLQSIKMPSPSLSSSYQNSSLVDRINSNDSGHSNHSNNSNNSNSGQSYQYPSMPIPMPMPMPMPVSMPRPNSSILSSNSISNNHCDNNINNNYNVESSKMNDSNNKRNSNNNKNKFNNDYSNNNSNKPNNNNNSILETNNKNRRNDRLSISELKNQGNNSIFRHSYTTNNNYSMPVPNNDIRRISTVSQATLSNKANKTNKKNDSFIDMPVLPKINKIRFNISNSGNNENNKNNNNNNNNNNDNNNNNSIINNNNNHRISLNNNNNNNNNNYNNNNNSFYSMPNVSAISYSPSINSSFTNINSNNGILSSSTILSSNTHKTFNSINHDNSTTSKIDGQSYIMPSPKTNYSSQNVDLDSSSYMMPSPKTSYTNNSVLSDINSLNYSVSHPKQSFINLTGLGNNNNNNNNDDDNDNNSSNGNLLPPGFANQNNPDASIYDNSESYDMSFAEKSRFDINPEGPCNGIKIPMPLPVINVNEVPVPSYTSSPLIIQAQQRNYQIWQNYQQIQNNGIPVSSALTLSLLRLMTENLTIARQNSSTITEKILNQKSENQMDEEMAALKFSSKYSENMNSSLDDDRIQSCSISDSDDQILEELSEEEKLDDKVGTVFKIPSVKKDERKSMFIDNLVLELYETECSYINNLSVMVDTIKSRLLEKKIIPEKAVEVIFFGLADIRDFSVQLRDSIAKATSSTDNKINAISEVFLKHVGDFNCYVNFVSNYSKACITVKSYEKSSYLFAEFLKSIPKMEECKRQDINSFFIMPIQRPMRYSLLLSELNKKNPENEGLEAAMNFMKEMAKTLNQVKRQEEEINGVYTIFNETLYCPRILIKNSEVVPKRLIKTYRGIIFKSTSANVHVMNDSILITKNRKDRTKYKYKFQFYIEYSSLIVKKSNKSDRNLAILINKNNPNNFVSKPGNLISGQRISSLHLKKGSKRETLVCILQLTDSKQAKELLSLINELIDKSNRNNDESNDINSSSNRSYDFYNESSSIFTETSLENVSLYDMSSILGKSIYSSRSYDGPKTRSIGPSNSIIESRSINRNSILDRSVLDRSVLDRSILDTFDESEYNENDYDDNDSDENESN